MFQQFFSDDNPFWAAMGRVFDAFVLNVLWLLCCLPVVTIGPSTTALYYAMINLVRGEETHVHKDFFRSFRRNFKQSTLAGLLLTGLGAFLAVDIYICRRSGTGIYTFLMVFFFIIFVFWAFVTLYTFPLLAKFENSIRNTLIWAFTLSVKHFPQTLLMLFLVVLAVWVCHLMPGLMFVAFGLVCEYHSTLFCSILRPWLDPDKPAGGEEEA